MAPLRARVAELETENEKHRMLHKSMLWAGTFNNDSPASHVIACFEK